MKAVTAASRAGQGRARWRANWQARWGQRALVLPIVLTLLVLGLYPLVFTVLASLSDSSLGRPFRGWVGLANYQDLLAAPDLREAFARTALYAVTVALLSVGLGLLSALALYHAARDRAWVRAALLLPLIVPPVIVGTLWKLIFNPGGGLLATLLGLLGIDAGGLAPLASPEWALPTVALADIWEWTPLVSLLVFAALLAQPIEILEAAALDGARGWAHFRHITLPAIGGVLAAAFFIRLVLAFKVFDLIFITTSGGPGQATTVASYLIYQLALRSFDIGQAAAVTLLLALLVTLATVPLARWTQRLHAH
ncbi:MAG: sugar ABC transporter permease [Comamonas sp.]